MARPPRDLSGSDDAPAQVIELLRQVRGKARPRVVFLFGKLVDLPGDVFRDVEGDVAVVAPLTIFRDAIEEEVGDLAGVVPVANPIKCPSFVGCQGQANTWL